MLKRMVEKGLNVAVVLDTCYSGGIGKDYTDEPRKPTIQGIQTVDPDGVDEFKLETDVSDIPQAELEAVSKISRWLRHSDSGSRLLPQGWVIIADC